MPDPHWTEYVGAFGGFAAAATAVGIALWGNRRFRRQQPDLRLLYDHDDKEDFAVGLNNDSQHWVRLRVWNRWGRRTGRRSADEVEVLIVGVSRHEGAELHGFSLIWSSRFDENGRPVTRLAIPPGVWRHVDVFSVHQPRISDGAGGAVLVQEEGQHHAGLQLEIQPRPRGDASVLPAGNYTIVVAVTARDTDAHYYEFDVEFDGLWWRANSIREHLTVHAPKRLSARRAIREGRYVGASR